MNEWKVVLIPGAPVWPIDGLVIWDTAPDGLRVATINCTTVHAPGNGLLELTLAPQGTNPVLTLLVRQDQVMLAIRVRPNIATGFAALQPTAGGTDSGGESGSHSDADAPPLSAPHTPDTA